MPHVISETHNGKHGIELLHDPELNKSTAFSEAERQALGLVGLLPDTTESIWGCYSHRSRTFWKSKPTLQLAFAELIFKRGLARVPRPKDIHAFIESQVYRPHYPDSASVETTPNTEVRRAA